MYRTKFPLRPTNPEKSISSAFPCPTPLTTLPPAPAQTLILSSSLTRPFSPSLPASPPHHEPKPPKPSLHPNVHINFPHPHPPAPQPPLAPNAFPDHGRHELRDG
ncbi:hypothetical protein EJ04DRAFT_306410 [Polyplosphaeria fusca]|uniref:Uncharacterized protein n=1 Tax=Polyplosphaeria fusca TaxID=682080 RepID=A0A9P4QW60_9PLEO|nr:hypothetical protein EJ04DRAFT_306410 [Polyplosphaeria fusca]